MLLIESREDCLRWYRFEGAGLEEGWLPGCGDLSTPLEALLTARGSQAVGYLLSNGGAAFPDPVTPLNHVVLDKIERCLSLAPTANRLTLAAARTGLAVGVHAAQFLLCETGFFSALPESAAGYALPDELASLGLRRFGGDGLVHQWAWQHLTRTLPGLQRLVSIHLGERPSVAAILDGKPVETSDGCCSSESLPSITGVGDLDPSVVLLLRETGLSPEEIEDLLTHKSGWQALAGQPVTFADLLTETSAGAHFARQVVRHHLIEAIGAALASLGGAEALVFPVDDPQSALEFIRDVCRPLAFTGLTLHDLPFNGEDLFELTSPASSCQALVLRSSRPHVLADLLLQAAGSPD
jgi:acetate kinase